ncbi:MAG: hypothetical protein H9W83_12440 [Leuconostoc sp.]|nr:hypothetical protein [Leuconostoc sp.]
MSITETLINYMYSLKAKGITYSMVGSRTGRDGTGDCSGTIYAGLVAAGLPTLTYPFSTESEHAYLLNNGYELIAHNTDWNAQRGDIFVWGEKGSSNGAGGHTGVFVDADNIIHTNYGYNGTTVNDYNTIYGYNNPNGVYVYRLKNEPKQETKPVEVPENPVKANLEEVNVNTQAFLVKGWLVHTKNDLKGTTPFLFFIDDETGKELTRVKGERTSRPDVAKVIPNPQNDSVGFKFSGATPKQIEDKKYRVMVRMSDEKGNTSYAEIWFPNNFMQAAKVDTGNLDLFKLENGKLRAAGWHLASNQKQGDYHYLFIMDRETNKEITRYDITANSYQKSDDVKKAFNNNQLAQASKCRFDASVDVKDVLKNKNVYVMSRYCYDALGNDGVSGQYSFKDTVIFI